MQTKNLRNKPVDKRRLSAQDKSQYQSNNRRSAVARARARRGQMAWKNNTKVGRQEQTPGTGGVSLGRGTQQQRLREKGQELARSKELRSGT